MPKQSRQLKKTARGRTQARNKRRSKIEHNKIDQALCEPVIVVESPCFTKKNAEALVFEIPDTVPRLSVSWYSPAVDRAGMDEPRGRVPERGAGEIRSLAGV